MKNIIDKLNNKLKTAIGIIRLFKDWPKFFLCYINVIKKNDILLRFRNGLKWHVDTTKRGFAVLGDVWIQQPYRLIDKIKNPEIILDLGAHIGSFSILAAKKYPKSKIYAFEASRENFLLLKKNLAANKIRNVIAFNIGVGSEDGVLDFFINKRNTVLNSFIRNRQNDNLKSYKVDVKKLATIFSEMHIKKCDFMKIDIEGLELEVLRSAARDNMLGRINAIAAEIKPDSKDFKKTAELLSKQKFAVSKNKDIINAVR